MPRTPRKFSDTQVTETLTNKDLSTPYATATPSQYVTGAASNVQGSMVLAAAAGVAAFLFA